jgi:type I restriction enzyme M protein
MNVVSNTMDLTTLQNWLWPVASSIRGEVDAARYKDCILPLIFCKRIADVFDDELARVGKALSVDPATAGGFVAADRSLVRFYLPADARWQTIRGRTAGLGEHMTDLFLCRNLIPVTAKKEGFEATGKYGRWVIPH